jgi:hypothetical protein
VLVHAGTGRVLAARAEVAAGWGGQLRGLIGRGEIASGFALGLPGCCQVHTALLAGPLDVAFCDRDGRVLRLVASLAPRRVSGYVAGAAIAWEAAAGTLAPWLREGDALLLLRDP